MLQNNWLISLFPHLLFVILTTAHVFRLEKEQSAHFLFDWCCDLASPPRTIVAGGFLPTSSLLICEWLLHSVPGSETRQHTVFLYLNVHYTRLNIQNTVLDNFKHQNKIKRDFLILKDYSLQDLLYSSLVSVSVSPPGQLVVFLP